MMNRVYWRKHGEAPPYRKPSVVVTANSGIYVHPKEYGSSAAIAAEISIATAAAGTAVSAAGSEQQASYQAAVAKNNQTIAGMNATLALQQGQQAAQAKQRQTSELIGKERAAAGASNVELDSGSPLRIQKDTAELGELDTLTIQNNAARQAWNYRAQGAAFGAEASQDETAGNLNAFASLIGGASSVSGKWSQYQNSGVFD